MMIEGPNRPPTSAPNFRERTNKFAFKKTSRLAAGGAAETNLYFGDKGRAPAASWSDLVRKREGL